MATNTCDDRLLGESTAWVNGIGSIQRFAVCSATKGPTTSAATVSMGRLFLCQSNGSHRFAAARYIADQLEVAVPVSGKLKTVVLNEAAVDELNSGFHVFAMPNLEAGGRQLRYRLRDALEAMQATSYYRRDLPFPYNSEGTAILLPRSDHQSMVVAEIMVEHGVFDLGLHLVAQIQKQALIRDQEQRSSLQIHWQLLRAHRRAICHV